MQRRNKMILSKETYYDKVRGCWLGKNIGGTLGAPFEAYRQAFDIDFYTHNYEQEGVLANDDLDLQLAWLNAAERFGPAVNSKILAEYWISTIIPNWAEYGVSKANMRMGVAPPVSGGFNNAFKDSNGAWIRSELWACLAPGHPEIAVKYAYEDACVDHADEGVYAEVFTAAIESAAFVESGLYELVEIGLSYIPKDCGVAKAVKIALECYKSGLTWKEARIKLLTEVPDSFGAQRPESPNPDGLPVAPWGYDAPSNVGLVIIGWLYGEGDFGKSICIAAGCAEDGDCTTATLGSVLGIINGEKNLPEKWIKPIGDEIKTVCLNLKTGFINVPKTVTELTNRTCALMPAFINGNYDFMTGDITVKEGKELFDSPTDDWMIKPYNFSDRYNEHLCTFTADHPLFNVKVSLPDGIEARPGDIKKIKIHAENMSTYMGVQQWLQLRWLLPEGEGWSVSAGKCSSMFLNTYHCGTGHAEVELELTVGEMREPRTTVVLEVAPHDRPTKVYVPIEIVCV